MEYAFVQAPFGWPALPKLLVVVVQALVMGAEFLEAGLVDIFDTGVHVSKRPPSKAYNYPAVRLPSDARAHDHRERVRRSGARSGVARRGFVR